MITAYVVNSVAVDRCNGRWCRLQNHMENNGHSAADVRMTKALGEATRLARETAQSGYRMVVAVGLR